MNFRTKRLGLVILLSGCLGNAFAIAPGAYVGIQGGYSNTNNEEMTIVTGGTPGVITVSPSSTGFGGRFFGGYTINPYVGWELGLTHYANATYSTNIPGKCNDPQIHTNALDFVVKGTLPFADTFDVFAKAGGSAIQQSRAGSLNSSSTSLCGNSSSNTTTVRPTAAVGASYYFSQNWVSDITVSRVFGNSSIPNADLLALGITYHFVDKYCGQFLC